MSFGLLCAIICAACAAWNLRGANTTKLRWALFSALMNALCWALTELQILKLLEG